MRHTARAVICASLAVACTQEIAISPEIKDPVVPEDTDLILPGLQPDIEVTPATLSFGELPPGCPAPTQDVTVKNVGQADLEVDDISIKGPSRAPYTLRASAQTLAPGDSLVVTVGFEALAVTDYGDAHVEVSSNDPDEGLARVELDATGSIAAFKKDQFIQEEGGGVDVLFTIDYSGSMSEELQALQNTFDAFITNFVALGLDYHIAVTTADENDATFRGPVIDPSTPDPVGEFVRQTGLGGGGGEMPYAASKNALTAPLVTAENAGFLRADATLAIVAVSDEIGDDTMSAGDYVRWLKSLKADPTMVSFSGVVPPETGFGCIAAPLPSKNYHTAIRQTGGVWGNICNLNFRPFLSYLSYVAAGLEFRFTLTETPTSTNPSAFTVTVDGVALPFDSIAGWTYDAATNTVELHGNGIPDPGAAVEVRYPYDPGC